MHLVPIPTTHAYLKATFPVWFPFLKQIAQRSPWSITDLIDQIGKLEVQPVLVWDDNHVARALLGVRYINDPETGDLVGQLVWLTGKHREQWQHLLSEVERYLRDMKCKKCQPNCRRGWVKFLERNGYEIIAEKPGHVVMEKVL